MLTAGTNAAFHRNMKTKIARASRLTMVIKLTSVSNSDLFMTLLYSLMFEHCYLHSRENLIDCLYGGQGSQRRT